jgi:hypothetical protein
MEKSTRVRSWTEEEIKAGSGWTIHFGPLLRPEPEKARAEPKPKRRKVKRK